MVIWVSDVKRVGLGVEEYINVSVNEQKVSSTDRVRGKTSAAPGLARATETDRGGQVRSCRVELDIAAEASEASWASGYLERDKEGAESAGTLATDSAMVECREMESFNESRGIFTSLRLGVRGDSRFGAGLLT